MTLNGTFSSHLRATLRTLWRKPAFTITALAMLSLGVGTVSALFSVVDRVLLEPLPYRDPDRLVQLITISKVGEQRLSSIPKFLFWQDHTTAFEAIAAVDGNAPEVNLSVGSYRTALKAVRVSAQYFHVLGIQLANGRTFSDDEDSPGGPRAVVISDAIRRQYLGSHSVVDREILLDNVPHRVTGVLAPGNPLESSAGIWLPLAAERRSTDHIGRVDVIARLQPGISLQQAQKEVGDSLGPFRQRYPPFLQFGPPALFAEAFQAIPLRDAVVGDVRPSLYLMIGAAGFLLAICCTNTATLLLSNGSQRTREMAIRVAAGAQPAQIVFHLLREAALLSLGGGVAGFALGYLGVHAVLAISPADLPRIGANGSAITLDWRVFLFTLLVSVLIGMLCGVVPAIHASRTNINVLLKDSTSQSGMSFRRSHWRSNLVIAEVSCSLVLLVGAGLLIRTFVAERAVNRGFDEENVITLDMSLSNPRFNRTAEVAQLIRNAEDRTKSLPGVVAIATTGAWPLASSLPLPFSIHKNDHSLVGRYDGTATWRSVSPAYFKVFQIRLLRGRTFTAKDDEKAARVTVINRAMLTRYWQAQDADPIGDFIAIGDGLGSTPEDLPWQIVGVVADVRDAGLDREPSMYVPVAQVSNWMNTRNNRLRPMIWAIRTDGPQPSAIAKIQRELLNLSGGQPLGRARTMHERIALSSARTQFYMTLLTVFAVIALLLTAAGLYGLMSHAVRQRAEELAIRSALGATPGDVQQMVVLQALRLTFLGTVAGIPLALDLGRVTISLIFGVKTWDPLMLLLVALLLGAVSFIAAFVPSVRASRVNPAAALRS